MERAGVREQFTTRNVMERPTTMSLALVEWAVQRRSMASGRSTAIGTAGTRVELVMKFEFANPVVSLLFGKAFESSVGHLIDAFVTRARSEYASARARAS